MSQSLSNPLRKQQLRYSNNKTTHSISFSSNPLLSVGVSALTGSLESFKLWDPGSTMVSSSSSSSSKSSSISGEAACSSFCLTETARLRKLLTMWCIFSVNTSSFSGPKMEEISLRISEFLREVSKLKSSGLKYKTVGITMWILFCLDSITKWWYYVAKCTTCFPILQGHNFKMVRQF